MRYLLAFLMLFFAVQAGEVLLYRDDCSMTARPFTPAELRTVFTRYGKMQATVDEPGQMPADWSIQNKKNQQLAAKLLWNATFSVEHAAAYSFALTSPNVCSALFVDGIPAASWMEHFTSMQLAEGTHTIQLFAVMRAGETAPRIVASLEGYPVKLKYEKLLLPEVEQAAYLVQSGAGLALTGGKVVSQEGELKSIIPGMRLDTRAHISKMRPVYCKGKPFNIAFQLDYQEAGKKLLEKTEVLACQMAKGGKIAKNSKYLLQNHGGELQIDLQPNAEVICFSFKIAGVAAYPEVKLHLVRADSMVKLRPSGSNLFVGDDRAVLLVDADKQLTIPENNGRILILDAIGDASLLALAQKHYPAASVKQVSQIPGTAAELSFLKELPLKADKVVFLGRTEPEILLFLCQHCIAHGICPVTASLPEKRENALLIKEMGYQRGIEVLDLWSIGDRR